MALFKILKGSAYNLNNPNSTSTVSKITTEGYAYFTPEDGKFYIDIESGQTPYVGRSQNDIGKNGEKPNRICMNTDIFGDDLILDCGVVGGNDNPEAIVVTYQDCGNAASIVTDTTIVLNYGDSNITEPTSTTMIYNCGSSFTK